MSNAVLDDLLASYQKEAEERSTKIAAFHLGDRVRLLGGGALLTVVGFEGGVCVALASEHSLSRICVEPDALLHYVPPVARVIKWGEEPT